MPAAVTTTSVVGDDWRVTGVVQGSGTITRDGKDTDVLVCVHSSDAAFYYDTKEQVLFDSVTYPINLEGDAWEAYRGVDFSDLNGDGSSDVTMNFDDGGAELLMVWFWDAESEMFMFEPDESQLGEDEGRGDLIPDEGNAVPVLMGGALPFTNMENVQSENYDDGTYYYADVTEDGWVMVVNTAMQRHWEYDVQTLEEYYEVHLSGHFHWLVSVRRRMRGQYEKKRDRFFTGAADVVVAVRPLHSLRRC